MLLKHDVSSAVEKVYFSPQKSTDMLIDKYYLECLEHQQQIQFDCPLFGVLTVRVYFNHDCLFVEVLKARDVIPLDSNGEFRTQSDVPGRK